MTRTFIMTKEFDSCWKSLNLDDNDLKNLQSELLESPAIGDRIPGTGGIRKYRFALEGRGKSGGARVCYLDVPSKKKLFLITAYAKNKKENLTIGECNALRELSQQLSRNTH